MAHVLRGEEGAVSEVLHELTRRHQPRHRRVAEAGRAHELFADFGELWNSFSAQAEAPPRRQVAAACVARMERGQRLEGRSPDLPFFHGVVDVGRRLSAHIDGGQARDRVATCPVGRVTKTGVVTVEDDEVRVQARGT